MGALTRSRPPSLSRLVEKGWGMDPTLMVGVEEMRAYRNFETLTFDELADLLLEFADRWPGTWEAVDALAAYLAKPHAWRVDGMPASAVR